MFGDCSKQESDYLSVYYFFLWKKAQASKSFLLLNDGNSIEPLPSLMDCMTLHQIGLGVISNKMRVVECNIWKKLYLSKENKKIPSSRKKLGLDLYISIEEALGDASGISFCSSIGNIPFTLNQTCHQHLILNKAMKKGKDFIHTIFPKQQKQNKKS